MVIKLKKALYGLKQAPRVWYSILENYILQQGFKIVMVDSNLYVKIMKDYQLIIIFYVDDIIFGGCKDEICKEFIDQMQNEFEISMLCKFSYFLGLQVSQLDKYIHI